MTTRGGLILAGGESRRFGGRDKSLLRVTNGRSLLAEVAHRLGFLDELVVSTSSEERATVYSRITGSRAVVDRYPGILGGMLAGLESMSSGMVFVAAVDMPLLRRSVIERQFSMVAGHDAVVPHHPNGFLEPLHLVVTRDPAVSALNSLCSCGVRKVARLFDEIDTLYLPVESLRDLDPKLESFTNVNDQRTLARVLK